MMSTLDVSLREEILILRKKLVILETAESDNERLRKEMTKLKMNMHEEKSKLELEFMNQLSEVIRENALKMEEITGQLRESHNVNRALSEQLKPGDSCSKDIDKSLQDLEKQHKNEILKLEDESNRHLCEVGRISRQLHDAEKSRDELAQKLQESNELLDTLKRSTNDIPSRKPKKNTDPATVSHTQNIVQTNHFENENRALKNTIALLQKENREVKSALDNYRCRKLVESEDIGNETLKSDLKKQPQNIRDSTTLMENESRDLCNSSRHENDVEQTREFGKSTSVSKLYPSRQQRNHGEPRIKENRTSRIIQQLEKNMKSDGQKSGRSSLQTIKTPTANGKVNDIKIHSLTNEVKSLKQKLETERKEFQEQQKGSKRGAENLKSQISKLEAELLSTKDLLASKMDASRARKEALDSKLEAVHGTRATINFEKERLVAETNRITEKKNQLERKAKHQHQQLKHLQKVVDEKLDSVEKRHQNDEIQIQSLQEQVNSLKRELMLSQNQVSYLNKALGKKANIRETAVDLARNNVHPSQAQIDRHQRELAMKNGELSELKCRHKKEIAALESLIESVHQRLSENMKARDIEIDELKGLSNEKDTISQRLEKEKEQLVLSMQDMIKNRGNGVEDLHNEILEMSTRLANGNREISTLKSRLEDSNNRTAEMDLLREQVSKLSRQLALKKNNEQNTECSVLERENRELRRKLKEASFEQSKAEEKLRKYVSGR